MGAASIAARSSRLVLSGLLVYARKNGADLNPNKQFRTQAYTVMKFPYCNRVITR